MMIWIILLAMTAAAVMAVLWPLSRHGVVAEQADPNTRFYREQLAEIERDCQRGALLPTEAEAARAEAARRLLRASQSAGEPLVAVGEPALRRRRAASTLALSVVPILALAVYGALGSPHIAEQKGCHTAQGPSSDLGAAIGQIEAHLANNPQDGRGWEVIAPVYLRMGRMDDAIESLRGRPASSRTQRGTPGRLRRGPGHRQGRPRLEGCPGGFREGSRTRSVSRKARLYLARAAEQDGRIDKAREDYAAILTASPSDAPWVPLVREQIARLDAVGKPPPGPIRQRRHRRHGGGPCGAAGSPRRQRRRMGSADPLLFGTGPARQSVGRGGQGAPGAGGKAAGLQAIDTMSRELQLTDAPGHPTPPPD